MLNYPKKCYEFNSYFSLPLIALKLSLAARTQSDACFLRCILLRQRSPPACVAIS